MKEMQLVKHLLQLVLSYNYNLNCPNDTKGMRMIRIPFLYCFKYQTTKL